MTFDEFTRELLARIKAAGSMTQTEEAIELGRAQACCRWHAWVHLAEIARGLARMTSGYLHGEDANGLRRREHRASVNLARG